MSDKTLSFPVMFTTGHDSTWNEWRCYKVGVHLCVFAGGKSVRIAPYPGRGLKLREEALVWDQYLDLKRTLTVEELRAIIAKVHDEEIAEKFAASLKDANK